MAKQVVRLRSLIDLGGTVLVTGEPHGVSWNSDTQGRNLQMIFEMLIQALLD
jgi:hypothetical protein